MAKRHLQPAIELVTALTTGNFAMHATGEFALRDADGALVQFDLVPGRAVYVHLEDARGYLHCYTPWKDTRGRYWVWSYRPIGRGARSLKARNYTMVSLRWFRQRQSAKRVAMTRHERAAK